LVVVALAYRTYNSLVNILIEHNLVDMVVDISKHVVVVVELDYWKALEVVG